MSVADSDTQLAADVSVAPVSDTQAAGGYWADLRADTPGMIGVICLGTLFFIAVFAPLLAPYDPAAQDIISRLQPPVWLPGGSWEHLLGTDHLGRDVLSRLLHGSSISLFVGFATVLLAGTFGVLLGLISGYVGGRTDQWITAITDIQVAFPGLLLALMILAVIGPSMTTVIVVLAVNGWMVYARLTRSVVLGLRQTAFVEAAELLGCRTGRILIRHLLPNLAAPLLTIGTLEFARIVLAEAALSFLGLGVQPPATSWGLDVAQGKDYMFRAWWLVTFPGLAIAFTVLAINLIASWLRVTTDPVEREKRYARRVGAAE